MASPKDVRYIRIGLNKILRIRFDNVRHQRPDLAHFQTKTTSVSKQTFWKVQATKINVSNVFFEFSTDMKCQNYSFVNFIECLPWLLSLMWHEKIPPWRPRKMLKLAFFSQNNEKLFKKINRNFVYFFKIKNILDDTNNSWYFRNNITQV